MQAMASESSDTVQIPSPSPADERRDFTLSSGTLTVDVAGLSHRGNVRANNEDHFLICRYGRFLEALASNLPLDDSPGYIQENAYAMVVADGMGGHAAGEVASRLAINSLVRLALDTPDWVLRFDEAGMTSKVMDRAVERARQIKDILIRVADHDPGLRGYGTTLALAWSVGKDLFVLHVGDSRVYLFRQGKLQQLTRDHTVAQDLVETGFIAQTQVAEHFFRHHLSQCLNDSAAKVQPEVQHIELQDGDRILLCSDGLTDMIDNQAINAILDRSVSAQTACSELIKSALAAGGRDNVTAIVAGYKFSVDD
jgi:protein phosphatase